MIRYIHLNPIRARVVKGVEELGSYPWSGHGAIIGKYDYKWMDTEYVLRQFASKRRSARKEYKKFIIEGLNDGRSAKLTGGGLIRSLGGWSQVVSKRRKDRKVESDERILGSSDFVNSILKETEERQMRRLKLRLSGKGIEDIIEEECTKRHISPLELKSGSRRNKISHAHAIIAYRCMEEVGITTAEIARHLGVNTSAITKAIARVEKKDSR